jgi:hypothetical protein
MKEEEGRWIQERRKMKEGRKEDEGPQLCPVTHNHVYTCQT